MYPLAKGLFAARNQWYVAAWSKHVTRSPMERWILNEPVALYRTESGKAVALEGRCPHRHFPLGKSRVVNYNIECGYHGITFGPDGTCVRIPSQTGLISRCRVKSYPVVEHWKWIWIWMGDPQRADPALIPDHHEIGLTAPEYQVDGDSYHQVPGRYMLMHDNLFDLTHLSYLHRTSIASGDFAGTRQVRDSGENWISARHEFNDIECPPFYTDLLGYRGRIDRKFGIKLFLPCLHVGYDRFYRASTELEEPGRFMGEVTVFHAITPATRHTAHYFFAMGRTFKREDAVFGRRMMDDTEAVIEEDMTATREIEAMIQGLDKEPHDLLLKADTTCVLGRRLFESLIRKEQEELRDDAGDADVGAQDVQPSRADLPVS
jgi:phenylpropionate dioxygenase-like ring-hydroxylating dioxygenase large terminal subunit